ncbi:N-acetylglucosamine kinase-like BadF-type ATPase [Actinopolyspora biskrensis]|uniref:N-acetylglucosamine kinase-like BadF-type ATPase n=1 Tax=Actinopolyspora biskrensis TaxID=1470178 RepID=A0A852YY47_9ACTN|nr:BadF/BadG/BcrA/BcrD ATPase family protein [Actinopolyspora biskrensis]NYH79068.1 N-acetylglucosamine kinase-like BadF-type ATPase [Actinopolyspora biskrensis]
MTETTGEGALVLGLDVGGTSSRAVVADLNGRTLGAGQAGGGNPNSHPPERATEQVARAARTALAEVDPSLVGAAALGMAGISKMSDPAVSGLFDQAWSALGLRCAMRTVSDGEVAFAAGTPEPRGTALIAGTGSIVARIENHELERTVGGYGWLLGDEGSAFWLGREAVTTTLRSLDHGEGRHDPLVASVLDELLGTPSTEEPDPLVCRRIISIVGGRSPMRLAELAPLVTATAAGSGGKATDIVTRAARMLASAALSVRTEQDDSPVVLAGSLLTGTNPLVTAVRNELAERGATRLPTARSGALGAAWLAAGELTDEAHARELHAEWLGRANGAPDAG